jgi:Bacterial SH3 domain
MSDPGLTNRLRQRSRRAGLAVGLSMALTIAVCIGSFAWIFVRAEPLFADLVGNNATAVRSATRTSTPSSDGDDEAAAPVRTPTAEPTREEDSEPTETAEPRPTATATPEQFQATHLTNPNSRVNFRPDPSLNNEPITQLPPSTPIQAIGGDETDSDGNQWLEFRTEDGQVGWLRFDAFVPI